MTVSLTVLGLFLFLSLKASAHTCIHSQITHNISVIDRGFPKDFQPSDGRNLQEIYENIRIHTDFTCKFICFNFYDSI